MRIVITGASGNVGTALLRRLRNADADHELVGICRRIPTRTAPYDTVTWVQQDLTAADAPKQLEETFRGADAVVHLAWGFQPSRDIAYLGRLGVGGTHAVLTAADAVGVPHLVHISSVGAYSAGRHGVRVDESWPTEGISSHAYSRQKAACERILDQYEASAGSMVISRIRPALVGQRAAGSALLRYGIPAWVPARIIGQLPVLPLDRTFVVPMVHADDVADCIARVVEQTAPGAFNVSADPPVTRELVAKAMHARAVHLPKRVMRALLNVSWRTRIQALDPGWLDLAFAVPLMDTTRARTVLGWAPTKGADEVIAEVLAAMADSAHGQSPVLRKRSVGREVKNAVTEGEIGNRKLP